MLRSIRTATDTRTFATIRTAASTTARPLLDQVDLGFAGRLPDQHLSLRAISELKTGDAIGLRRDSFGWLLVDSKGRLVGRLAKRFHSPEGMTFLRGEVLALVERHAKDAGDEYRAMLRRGKWEVVIPELVFEPTPA